MKKVTVNTFLKKQIPLIILSSLFLVLSAFLSVVFAFLLANIIEAAINFEMDSFYRYSLYSAIAMAASLVLQVLGDNIRKKYAYNALVLYKDALLNKVLVYDFRYYLQKPEAHYMNILTKETDIISENYYMQIAAILQNGMQIIFSVLALIYVDWRFFVIVLILCMAAMAFPNIVAKKLQKKLMDASKQNESYLSYLKSILGGFEVIKTFSLKDKILQSFSTVNKTKEYSQYTVGVVENIRNAITIASSFFIQMGAIMAGTYLVLDGRLTIVLLFAGIQVVGSLVSPIGSLTQRITWFFGSKAIINKHNEILFYETENKEEDGVNIETISDVVLNNVSFSYNEEEDVLQDISCSFHKNKKYAVIGESGSGKSTLLKLIMGYYQNYTGEITVNHSDYAKVNLASLYSHSTMIHQTVVLFEDTFENNIKLFRNISDEVYNQILVHTNLAALNKRYHDGKEKLSFDSISELSGGEKQRIAIARSLIQNSSMILFDEAASALDPNHAGQIYNLLFGLKDVLFIAITHIWEDELLDRFDEVLYMEKGKVLYRGLWKDIKQFVKV